MMVLSVVWGWFLVVLKCPNENHLSLMGVLSVGLELRFVWLVNPNGT